MCITLYGAANAEVVWWKVEPNIFYILLQKARILVTARESESGQ